MKNGAIYHIISLLLVSFIVFGCRSTKNIERNEATKTGSLRIERSSDTIRTIEVRNQRSNRSVSELEQIYSRVTEFDSTGSVRRVSEEWRDRRYSDLADEERDERAFSVAVSEEEVITRDTASVTVQETIHSKTDSRPVQGADWFWVILSAVLILAVVIYIIYNKVN